MSEPRSRHIFLIDVFIGLIGGWFNFAVIRFRRLGRLLALNLVLLQWYSTVFATLALNARLMPTRSSDNTNPKMRE